ncbi:MAG TPA: hypothetical protein VFM16_09715 [Holophagaceae bacterium]|nr:hypothetical protein [Holophagaceae bacterium]
MAEPAPLPRTETSALLDGLRFLRRRPGWTFGLLALGTLLGQLGPALELLAKAGRNPLSAMALGWAAALPLEFYFIPRWISRLDADLLDAPGNPAGRFPELFDQRWLRAFGASLLVQALGGMGLLLLLIPGIILLTLLGFAPMRILLRGEPLGDALRWSAGAMARHWPRIVQAALAILLVAFAGALGVALAETTLFARYGADGPDAWTRLTHPAEWGLEAFSTLALLWLSAAFLSLYQRLERLAAGTPPPQPR